MVVKDTDFWRRERAETARLKSGLYAATTFDLPA